MNEVNISPGTWGSFSDWIDEWDWGLFWAFPWPTPVLMPYRYQVRSRKWSVSVYDADAPVHQLVAECGTVATWTQELSSAVHVTGSASGGGDGVEASLGFDLSYERKETVSFTQAASSCARESWKVFTLYEKWEVQVHAPSWNGPANAIDRVFGDGFEITTRTVYKPVGTICVLDQSLAQPLCCSQKTSQVQGALRGLETANGGALLASADRALSQAILALLSGSVEGSTRRWREAALLLASVPTAETLVSELVQLELNLALAFVPSHLPALTGPSGEALEEAHRRWRGLIGDAGRPALPLSDETVRRWLGAVSGPALGSPALKGRWQSALPSDEEGRSRALNAMRDLATLFFHLDLLWDAKRALLGALAQAAQPETIFGPSAAVALDAEQQDRLAKAVEHLSSLASSEAELHASIPANLLPYLERARGVAEPGPAPSRLEPPAPAEPVPAEPVPAEPAPSADDVGRLAPRLAEALRAQGISTLSGALAGSDEAWTKAGVPRHQVREAREQARMLLIWPAASLQDALFLQGVLRTTTEALSRPDALVALAARLEARPASSWVRELERARLDPSYDVLALAAALRRWAG